MLKPSINPMVYAALYLRSKSASEKVSFGQFIIDSMSSSGNFPSPSPSMAAMQTATDVLAAAIVKSTSNATSDKEELVHKEAAYDMMLTSLKKYAQMTANLIAAGNSAVARTILASGGFPIAKTRSKTAVPAAVTEVSAEFTNVAGTVDVSWKGVKNARSYQVSFSTTSEPTGIWQVATSTTARKFTVSGLTSGTRYYFRVTAVGVNGSSEPGTIATCIAS